MQDLDNTASQENLREDSLTYPRLSISACTTFTASFDEDLAAYAAAGADGIGLWEYKLSRGEDDRLRTALAKSGLKATICVPEVPSIVPDAYFREPNDPKSRTKELCTAIRRLAAYDPVAVMVLPGGPGDDAAATRRTVIEGMKVAADVAGEVGVTLGFEPLRESAGSIVTTLPAAVEFIEDIGATNMRVIYDTWHFWDTPGKFDHIRAHADKIIGVQINDWRDPRSWCDRKLPGDGIMDLPGILSALEKADYKGWYDVEVFSDNGVMGNAYPDSLWDLPAKELALRSVDSFHTVWDKRRASAPAR
jgi:sugar phosphate isomerase/epimerase